jgi:hypothetical protein
MGVGSDILTAKSRAKLAPVKWRTPVKRNAPDRHEMADWNSAFFP